MTQKKKKKYTKQNRIFFLMSISIITGVIVLVLLSMYKMFQNSSIRTQEEIKQTILREYGEKLVFKYEVCDGHVPLDTIGQHNAICWFTAANSPFSIIISSYTTIDEAQTAFADYECTSSITLEGYDMCLVTEDTFQEYNSHYNYYRRISWQMGHYIMSASRRYVTTVGVPFSYTAEENQAIEGTARDLITLALLNKLE